VNNERPSLRKAIIIAQREIDFGLEDVIGRTSVHEMSLTTKQNKIAS